MAKFNMGDWVRPRKGRQRGLVCGHRSRSVLVRWAGTQKAEPWGSRSLVACDPPRALVMEGTLDDSLESTRSEEDLLRTWNRGRNGGRCGFSGFTTACPQRSPSDIKSAHHT